MPPPAARAAPDREALPALRRTLRRRRRALRGEARRTRERAIHTALARLLLRRFRRIAAFEAIDGEPDLSPVIRGLRRSGRVIALPEVVRGGIAPAMRFVAPRDGSAEYILSPGSLDLVLVPLVGFDGRGQRIGFGAGYYDRAFRCLHGRRRWHRPQLVGVAFECQRVDSLPAAPWDIPLQAVVTERGLQRFKPAT